MSDPIDLSKMAPRDALEFAIGRYVTRFANLETILGTHAGYLLGIEQKLMFFILKDMFFDHKVKLLRRTVEQKFGIEKSAAYRAALNRATKAGEARNDLLHGAFAQDGDIQLRGRIGQSLKKLDEGFKETGYADLESEGLVLDKIATDLIAALPEENPSSSSSREQSGSGDQ